MQYVYVAINIAKDFHKNRSFSKALFFLTEKKGLLFFIILWEKKIKASTNTQQINGCSV